MEGHEGISSLAWGREDSIDSVPTSYCQEVPEVGGLSWERSPHVICPREPTSQEACSSG